MKKVYEVAGHKFAVVMPDNDLAWKEMLPYEPFEVEGDEALFSVEKLDLMPDMSTKQKVTSSCEAPDEPRIELYEWNGMWLLEMAPVLEAPVRVFLLTDKAFRRALLIQRVLQFLLHQLQQLLLRLLQELHNQLLM